MARTASDAPDAELAAPRHATLWAFLAYAVSSLLLGYPALGGQFLVNAHSDQYIAGYAFRDFAAQSLKAGHGIPQWEPFLQGGMPYIAAMHGDVFYAPTVLLRWILPTDVAMTWEFILHLMFCGLFTYLFLRSWRFGFWASLIGGLAYMLGGSVAGFASPGHDGKLFVATLLPAALYLLTRGVRDGRFWAWGLFSIVVGLAFVSHPQLFQYMLFAAGAFTLYVAFAALPGYGRLPRSIAIRRIGIALGAVILGCLLGAIQYWPSLIEYKPWSPRAPGHTWADATSFSYPIEEVLNWYWPQFTGILESYWGRNNIHLHSDYFGVVALLLAGAAFGATAHRSFRRFWIGVFIVSLIWAFGGNTPLYHVIMLVPYTKYLRAPSTMIYITSFATAMLVAIGTERVFAKRVSARYAMIWGIAAAVFAILMSVGGYSALANGVATSASGPMAEAYGYPPEAAPQFQSMIMERATQNSAAATIGIWRSFIFVALGAAVLWLLANGRIAARNAAIALAALVIVDLWSVEHLYWRFSPPAKVLFASDPAADAIKADIARTGEPGRVLNAPIGSGIVQELGHVDRAFTGDRLWVLGLRIPGGYHGNELGAYKRMMDIVVDSTAIQYSPAFWRHENVRYWYTGADEATMNAIAARYGLQPFQKLAGPVRNAAGSMVYSYKVSADNPAAWVATAMTKAPQDQALGTVLDPRFDPRTVAIVDTTMRDLSPAPLSALPAPATQVAKVTSYAPGAIDVKLDRPAAAGQALLVSENYFPGWHATADGKPVSVALMNYNLIGVPLPAGATSIQLRFTDAAYEKGKRVTAIALLLAIAAFVGGLVVDRRRDVPEVVPA
jgi:hypothetical protein